MKNFNMNDQLTNNEELDPKNRYTIYFAIAGFVGLSYLLMRKFTRTKEVSIQKTEPFPMEDEEEIIEKVSNSKLDQEEYNKMLEFWKIHNILSFTTFSSFF